MPSLSPISLCIFYFTAFALLGAYLPYFSLYAKSLGFSGFQIGVLAAAVPVGKVVFGPLWTYLADRLGSRKGVALLAIVLATAAFSLTLGFDSFPALCGVLYLYAALRAPQLPLVEATTLDLSQEKGWQYGRIRVWGSVGFIVTALSLGPLFERVAMRNVLYVVLLLLIVNVAATARIPATRPHRPETKTRLLPVVFQPIVLVFFVCAFLMQASHGAYYAFFSIVMKEEGYASGTIGLLWSLGVVAEIATMVAAAWLMRRAGVAGLMTGCLFLAALRWLAYGWGADLELILGAQLLHAFTFGAFHVAAVTGTYRLFPADLRASGQSLYTGVTFGAGSVLGFLVAGKLYESSGSAGLFQVSAWAALVAALLSFTLWRDSRLRRGEAQPTVSGLVPQEDGSLGT